MPDPLVGVSDFESTRELALLQKATDELDSHRSTGLLHVKAAVINGTLATTQAGITLSSKQFDPHLSYGLEMSAIRHWIAKLLPKAWPPRFCKVAALKTQPNPSLFRTPDT